MMFDQVSTSEPYIKAGKLRALAVTSLTRSPLFPALPTHRRVGRAGLRRHHLQRAGGAGGHAARNPRARERGSREGRARAGAAQALSRARRRIESERVAGRVHRLRQDRSRQESAGSRATPASNWSKRMSVHDDGDTRFQGAAASLRLPLPRVRPGRTLPVRHPTCATRRRSRRWRIIWRCRAISASSASCSCSRARTGATIPACSTRCAKSARPGCRGIVDIDENAPDAEFARLHAAGVRGVRINVSPVAPPEAGLRGDDAAAHRAPARALRRTRLAARFPHAGLADQRTDAGVAERCKSTSRSRTWACFSRTDGVGQPGFQQLLDLLRHGDGHCWVKLTGVYRMSVAPGFADAAPLARALIEAAPDRIIWGSDYPHLSFADKVGSVELFNLLGAVGAGRGHAPADSGRQSAATVRFLIRLTRAGAARSGYRPPSAACGAPGIYWRFRGAWRAARRRAHP